MQTPVTVLEHLLVVNLDIHIWSARKKLSPVDLGDALLPPGDLASLGSKRICNPEELRTFAALKARAINTLDRNGIRFLGGWAVPESRMDAISTELAAIRDEFNSAKDAFLRRYDQSIQDWIARHPQWGNIIADSIVSDEYVRSRMGFRWQMFHVSPPNNCDTATPDMLHEEISGLGATLFDEIAKAAKEAWQRCYKGKTEVTRKALSPLRSMHDKLIGLSFVEPHTVPIAELIQTAFAAIPKRGAITGRTLHMLQSLLCMLQSPSLLLEHSQGIIEGRQSSQGLLAFLAQPSDMDMLITIETDPVISDSECSVIPSPVQSPAVIESHGLW